MKYNYNYRVYGSLRNVGYKLICKTSSLDKALSYKESLEYDTLLIIRHNIDLNMDEPIVYETLDIKRKVRTR